LSTQKQLEARIAALESTLRQAKDVIIEYRNAQQGPKTVAIPGVTDYTSCVKDLINNMGYPETQAISQCKSLYPDNTLDYTKGSSVRQATTNPAWLVTKDYLMGDYVPTDKPSAVRNAHRSNNGMEVIMKTRAAVGLEGLDILPEPTKNIRNANLEQKDPRPAFIRLLKYYEGLS